MLYILNDIKNAYNAGAYRSALALALMVPDIGGQIKYPDIINVGTRYRKWFNQYVKPYYPVNPLLKSMGIIQFDAQACYKLRCAYLHSGHSRIDVDYISKLDFFFDDCLDDQGTAQIDGENLRVQDVHIRLNIHKLCDAIYQGGLLFYNSSEDKSRFQMYDIQIHDACSVLRLDSNIGE